MTGRWIVLGMACALFLTGCNTGRMQASLQDWKSSIKQKAKLPSMSMKAVPQQSEPDIDFDEVESVSGDEF